jgi:uncharacterized protein
VGNRIAYFEVGAAEFETLVSFYAELLGWTVTSAADGYALIDTRAGGGINGGIGRSRDGTPWVSFYVAVDDPQAVLDRADSLGGSTVMPVTEIPGMLTFAMFADPDGSLVGLVKAGGAAAPGPSAGEGVPVDWFEVLGSDAARTQRFYCELFGWTVDESRFPGYRPVDTHAGKAAIGGALGGGDGGSIWATVYANVPDVEATLTRAEQLGGSRVYGPNQVDDHTLTGALRDPAGNVFGLYEHRSH